MDNKARIENLRVALGNAQSKVNTLAITNTKLSKEQKELIIELKKSNELLTKANELIDTKEKAESEISAILDDFEKDMSSFQGKIEELEKINKLLIEQNEEIKKQSSSIYTKSLAIVGVFAGGAWLVVGVRAGIDEIKKRTN